MYSLVFWNGEYGINAEYREIVVREYTCTEKGIYAKRLSGNWEYVGIGFYLWYSEKL